MGLPRHPQVAEWLRNLDIDERADVDEALKYLEDHGRAATLPDVRHRVQASTHFPNMSELRVDVDVDHVYRVLVGFGPDDRPALLLAGKQGWFVERVVRRQRSCCRPTVRCLPQCSAHVEGAVITMTDLPEGWDVYEPDDHERSGEPHYRRARKLAAERAERRRSAYGSALAALRRARSLTQVTLAEQLGVAQGEVSRIEHQSDLLLSTLARYIDGMGGELALLVRFADQAVEIELGITESVLADAEATDETSVSPDASVVAELGAYLGRFELQESRFRAVVAA